MESFEWVFKCANVQDVAEKHVCRSNTLMNWTCASITLSNSNVGFD